MKVKEKIQKVTFINDAYTKWKWRERTVSYGNENPDKTFFVIRRATCKVGLFSHVMTNMGLVRYALEKNYIPVIDMQSNLNSYLEESQVGKENAWEFYFEQPCGYTLKDISKSRNVILSDGLITEKNEYPDAKITFDIEKYKLWRDFFNKYFHVKKVIKNEAESLWNDLFHGERVVGVLCRGTDYVLQQPKDHPIQPSVESLIEKASEIFSEYNCRWLYLATEDEMAYQKFSNVFKEYLKVTKAKRCENIGAENINEISFGRKNEKFLRGKEYLINILLLSQCNCLIAGRAGGTYGALMMGSEYEYQYIYNLGVY